MEVYKLNQKNWGVCGFVAAIQAAYYNGEKKQQERMESNSDYDIIFPVVKNFCDAYKDDKKLEKELLDFSKVFGELTPERLDEMKKEEKNYKNPYAYKSISEVIQSMKDDTDMEKSVGLAMSGYGMHKLCQYLKLPNTEFHGTSGSGNPQMGRELKPENISQYFPYTNTIYGLAGNPEDLKYKNFRYGLLHWVYVDRDKNLMSYGNIYPEQKWWDDFLNPQKYNKISHYLPL